MDMTKILAVPSIHLNFASLPPPRPVQGNAKFESKSCPLIEHFCVSRCAQHTPPHTAPYAPTTPPHRRLNSHSNNSQTRGAGQRPLDRELAARADASASQGKLYPQA